MELLLSNEASKHDRDSSFEGEAGDKSISFSFVEETIRRFSNYKSISDVLSNLRILSKFRNLPIFNFSSSYILIILNGKQNSTLAINSEWESEWKTI